MIAESRVRQDEGFRAEPYRCTEGAWTVGVGINIHDMRIPVDCATYGEALDWLCDPDRLERWFQQRLAQARLDAERFVGTETFQGLSERRKTALVSMAYQLGATRLSGFTKLRSAIQCGQWVLAQAEALDSAWAEQTPRRAKELASLLLEG